MMKNGLAAAMAASAQPIESLDPDALQALMGQLASDFRQTFAELVVEAAFAAPEYGGNGTLAGWKLIHFEGDVQPLGYSVFDEAANAYVERGRRRRPPIRAPISIRWTTKRTRRSPSTRTS